VAMASARSVGRLIGLVGRLNGRALRALVLVLAALIAAESAAAVTAATIMLGAQRSAEEKEAILAAARQQTMNWITIDYRQVDLDIQRISRGLTGKLRDDFGAKHAPRLAEAVRKAQTTSRGTAISAGIISSDEDSAEVIIAANSTLQWLNPQTAPGGKVTSVQRLWRFTLGMRKQGDRWLAEKMDPPEVIG
jgi:Mce-associated membrane protein